MKRCQVVNATKYMVEHGSYISRSGNCHFDFDEIGNLVGITITEKFKQAVREYALSRYGEAVREVNLDNGFDFVFNMEFCPNAAV